MHVCTCCMKEFHTKFLLCKHITASVACQHHFAIERQDKELERLRMELNVKNDLLRDLVKATTTLTQQIVELSQTQHDTILPKVRRDSADPDTTQTSNITGSAPEGFVMRLLERRYPLLPNPSTLGRPPAVAGSALESVMTLLESSPNRI